MTIRLAALTHHYPAFAGDTRAPFIAARMEALAKRTDVTVVHAQPWFRASAGPAPATGPEVARVRYWYIPGFGKRLDGRFLAASAGAAVRATRPDVIEAQFGYPDGEAAVRLARDIGCVAAVVLRGTEQILAQDPARRERLTATLRDADLVLPVSRSLAQFAESLGAARERIRVIENGVDAERFRPGDRGAARRKLGLPEGGRILVGVGHLLPNKGYDKALEAVAALRTEFSGLRLVLIGGGSDADKLRTKASNLGIADIVEFRGAVPHAEVAEHMRAADLFVHPSLSEGRPNAVLEAQACGIPVVATDVGATREVVEHGVTGLVVAAGDGAAFARAVGEALSRRFDPEAISRRAGARSWDDAASDLVAAYEAALARRRG